MNLANLVELGEMQVEQLVVAHQFAVVVVVDIAFRRTR